MKRRFISLIIITVMILGLMPAVSAYPSFTNADAWEVLRLTNTHRGAAVPLSTFDKLSQAAEVRRQEIEQVFDHTRPNGTSCFTVIDEFEIPWYSLGENIAKGHGTPAEVVDGANGVKGWMQSQGHRENIEKASFRHVGIGAKNRAWTQLFVGGCTASDFDIPGLECADFSASDLETGKWTVEITCNMHGKSYLPLSASMVSYADNGTTLVVTYDGITKRFAVNRRFSDVATGAWYEPAVSYCVKHGLFSGVSQTEFAPNQSMTRAMFVAVLARYHGAAVNDQQSSKFRDVPAGAWYTGSVNWAAENGIVSGYGNGSFGPADPISREQICAMLVSYCAFSGRILSDTVPEIVFNDDAKISSWAKESVYACQRSDLIAGYNGYFNPLNKATRAEVAQIMMNFCGE